jgi:hypothetical protein
MITPKKLNVDTSSESLVFSDKEKIPCFWDVKEEDGVTIFTNALTNRRLLISIEAFNKALQ